MGGEELSELQPLIVEELWYFEKYQALEVLLEDFGSSDLSQILLQKSLPENIVGFGVSEHRDCFYLEI